MNRVDLVEKYYLGEYNCSQSVVLTYADKIDISRKDLIKLASGFGGGIAGLQKTCGALTGGVIVLSLILNNEKKNDAIKELFKKFEGLNEYSNCINLIEVDFEKSIELNDIEKQIKQDKCLNFVKDVVKIIEKIV